MSLTKINWNTAKNLKLLDRYQELNLIPFSCQINEILRNDEPKKELKNMPSYSKINKYDDNLIRTYNGLCLKMGTVLPDNHFIILVDIDNKNDTLNIWNNLLKKNNKSLLVKTPTASTGNGGFHYFFKATKEQFNKMQNSYTKLTINGEKVDIDIKGNNQIALAEPTSYKSLEGKMKKYTWINDSIYKYGFQVLPDWLYNIIINSSTVSTSKAKPTKIKSSSTESTSFEKLTYEQFSHLKMHPSADEIEYFNCFSFDRLDNSSTWINVGFLCFSLYKSDGYQIWNALSKKSPKYKHDEIIQKWNYYISPRTGKYTKGSLMKFAEIDNKEEYLRIKKKYQCQNLADFLEDDPFIDEEIIQDTQIINQRYLLDKDKKLDDDSVVSETINNFFYHLILLH